VARRDTPWINYFLARGADPNAEQQGRDAFGDRRQHRLWRRHGTAAQFRRAPDESNATGETPLISAVHRRDLAMVRLLLKAGANPDRSDSAGRTARDYAKIEDRSGNLPTRSTPTPRPRPMAGVRLTAPACDERYRQI
jgi:hypothetical protein